MRVIFILLLALNITSVKASDLGSVTVRFIDTFVVYPQNIKNLTEENSNACIIETIDGISAHPGGCSKHIGMFLKLWEAGHPNVPYVVEHNGLRWGE